MAPTTHQGDNDLTDGGAVDGGLPSPSPLPVTADTAPPPAAGSAPARPAAPDELRPSRSAASTTYVGIGVGLVVLVIVLIFIIQNLHDASIHFFTADFSLPIGVLILAAVVAGGLLVLLASAARVLQLRAGARKHRKRHEAAQR